MVRDVKVFCAVVSPDATGKPMHRDGIEEEVKDRGGSVVATGAETDN